MLAGKKIKPWTLMFLISTFLSGCATMPPGPSTGYPSERDLLDLCEKHRFECQWDAIAQIVTLMGDHRRVRSFVGSDLFLVDGHPVRLEGPIIWHRSRLKAPMDFEPKVLAMILPSPKVKLRSSVWKKVRRVMIDAGHGGKDPGAMGASGLQEKTVVLDIARRLKRKLEKKGFLVHLTRKGDEFISLQKRTELASRLLPDLFISIHANSSPSRKAHGLEVYSLSLHLSDQHDESQMKTNQEIMFSRLSMKKGTPHLDQILTDMLDIHKQRESFILARQIARKTALGIRAKNRGPKEAKFYVLKNNLMPAILVEVGFLSNPREERLLETVSYRQRIADQLAESLLDYAIR